MVEKRGCRGAEVNKSCHINLYYIVAQIVCDCTEKIPLPFSYAHGAIMEGAAARVLRIESDAEEEIICRRYLVRLDGSQSPRCFSRKTDEIISFKLVGMFLEKLGFEMSSIRIVEDISLIEDVDKVDLIHGCPVSS